MDRPEVDVFPENWVPFEVFLAMRTQWRTGMSGKTGLDYGVCPTVADLLGIKSEDRRGVFGALQIMEGEALHVWEEARQKP